LNEGQDTDSGIEVKATITENKEGKDEPNTKQNESSTDLKHKDLENKNPDSPETLENGADEQEVKSPKSLKELSDNVVRASSSSNEEGGKPEGPSEDSVFANFESAFPEGVLIFCTLI